MEFVVVTFSTARSVNVDGAPRGRTGQLLRLQAGTHNFDLGTPFDYAPANVMAPVRGTTAAAPLVVAFMPRAGAMRRKTSAQKAPSRKGAEKTAAAAKTRRQKTARKTATARKTRSPRTAIRKR